MKGAGSLWGPHCAPPAGSRGASPASWLGSQPAARVGRTAGTPSASMTNIQDKHAHDGGSRGMSAMAVSQSEESDAVISTGIAGLDDILWGGLTPGRIYLVEGTPGTGKTT